MRKPQPPHTTKRVSLLVETLVRDARLRGRVLPPAELAELERWLEEQRTYRADSAAWHRERHERLSSDSEYRERKAASTRRYHKKRKLGDALEQLQKAG